MSKRNKKEEISLENLMETEVVLTEKAKNAKGIDISKIIDDLNYTDEQLYEGLDIYIELIQRIEENNNDNKEKKIEFYNNNNYGSGKIMSPQETRENFKEFYKNLKENKRDSSGSADPDKDKRKIQYRNILKGLRIIAEILQKNELDLESLAGDLSTIASLNEVCATGKVTGLRELIITYQENIQKNLGIETKNESNKVKQRLNNICEQSIKKITNKIKDHCLIGTLVGIRPHYQLMIDKYLNEKYGLNIPQVIEFSDSIFIRESDRTYKDKIKELENYLKYNDLEDMIIEDILKTYECILNGEKTAESSETRRELVDYWVDLYYGKEEKQELNNWGEHIIIEYKIDNIKDGILKSVRDEKENRHEKVIKLIESDIERCNAKFLSEYVDFYKNKDGERLIIEGIVSDKHYSTRQYLHVNKEMVKGRLKEILNSWDDNKNEDEIIKNIKELVVSTIRFNIKNLKLMYNSNFLEKYVYDDEYKIRKIAIEKILKDNGYLEERTYDKEMNEEMNEKKVMKAITRALYYFEENENIISQIKKLSKENQNLANKILFAAINKGNKDIVECLVENGVDVNGNTILETPLMCAIEVGNKDIVECLVEKGADINKRAVLGLMTPLTLAINKGNKDIVEYLVEKGSDINKRAILGLMTPLMLAIGAGNEDIVECLVEKGADVNKVTILGGTSLMCAIEVENKDIVKYLVEKGADVNKIAVLICAIKKGNKDIVKYLVEKGADVNGKTILGTTLTCAIEVGNKDIVKCLVEKGADVNKKTIFGKTPLMSAIEVGNKDIVKCLVEKGADVNKKTIFGKTPLMSAIIKGNKDIVECLVKHGANVNKKTIFGKTPLEFAIKKNNMKIAKILIKHGADIFKVKNIEENTKRELENYYKTLVAEREKNTKPKDNSKAIDSENVKEEKQGNILLERECFGDKNKFVNKNNKYINKDNKCIC